MKAPKMTKIPEKVVSKEKNYEGKTVTRENDPRPSFSVNEDSLPAIKDWSTGKKYKLEIEVTVTGTRIEDYGHDKGKLKADLKISGIILDNNKDEEDEFPAAMKRK